MKRSFLFAIAALLLLLTSAMPASETAAAVFSRDWQTPGDGLLTYDDVNQREWLDLPYLIDEFPVTSRDPERRYEAILPELQPGGSLQDFTVANSDDVIALALSAGIDVSTTTLIANESATRSLIEFLGSTDVIGGTSIGAVGLLDGIVSTADGPKRLEAYFRVIPSLSEAGVSLMPASAFGDDIPSRFTSVMLYRVVPEPSTFSLIIACASALFLLHKRDANWMI